MPERPNYTHIYFRDVQLVEEMAPDGKNLFPNIVIAGGKNDEEKKNYAIRTLVADPDIDTVVLLSEPKHLSLPLVSLLEVTQQRRIKIDFDKARFGIKAGVFNTLREFFAKRNFVADQEHMDNIANFLQDTHMEAQVPGSVSIMQTAMTFTPNYRSRYAPDNFINGHVDEIGMNDFRRIDCKSGSGTVFFDKRDFQITSYEGESGKYYRAIPQREKVRCLTLPPGSSAIIRAPSDKMTSKGLLPGFHAHGLAKEGVFENRLTCRHDLVLEQ